MTFVSYSLFDPIILYKAPARPPAMAYVSPPAAERGGIALRYPAPSPHDSPGCAPHLSVAEARSSWRALYPVEHAVLAADAIAVSLAAARDRVTTPLARAAAVLVRNSVWSVFGYARLNDHARERFGQRGQSVRDPASPGDAMARLGRMPLAHPVPDVFLRLRLPGDLTGALLSPIESRQAYLASHVDWLGRMPLAHPMPDVFLRLRGPGDLAGALLSPIESRRRYLASHVDRLSRETRAHPIPDVFLRLRGPCDLAGALLSSIESRRRYLASAGDGRCPPDSGIIFLT